MAIQDQIWKCPVCGRQASIQLSACPLCYTPRPDLASSLDNRSGDQQHSLEFSAINTTTATSSRTRKRLPPEVASATLPPDPSATVSLEQEDTSAASVYFVVIAWVLFIGGLFVAYQSANIPAGKYYSEFSWSVFFQIYMIYAVAGGFAMCASEVCKNIQSIANSLKKINAKK